MIKPGDAVIFVGNGGTETPHGCSVGLATDKPQIGAGYRIREILKCPITGYLGCRLVGMRHQPTDGYLLYWNGVWRFRLVEKADEEFCEQIKNLSKVTV